MPWREGFQVYRAERKRCKSENLGDGEWDEAEREEEIALHARTAGETGKKIFERVD